MYTRYKVKLLPNDKQASRMLETANASRYMYNWAIGKMMEGHEKYGCYYEGSSIQAWISQHKDENPWLRNVSSSASIWAVKDCCEAFYRFTKMRMTTGYLPYSKKKLASATRNGKELTRYDMIGHPKFKKKGKAKPSFYTHPGELKITETHVKLEKLSLSQRRNKKKLNWVRLAETGRIPLGQKYENPRVTFDGINWWFSVAIDCDFVEEPLSDKGIGIDVGVRELAVCSDGYRYENINKTKEVRRLEKRLKRIQRKVSRKYDMNNKESECNKTANILKGEREVLKTYQRISNIRRNYVHQVTSEIIGRKPSFVVTETLDIRGMAKNKYLAKDLYAACLYEFIMQIGYKSKWIGAEHIKADRSFPSTRVCCICGNVKPKFGEKTYHCSICGNTVDRDEQASINLENYGKCILNSA